MAQRGVYVVRCLDGRSYIGLSEDIDARFRSHRQDPNVWIRDGGGVAEREEPWVKPEGDLSEWERHETLVRMVVEGIAVVRGWEFVTPLFTKENRKHICTEITGAFPDLCRRCGYLGHKQSACWNVFKCASWKDIVLGINTRLGNRPPRTCVCEYTRTRLSTACGTFKDILLQILRDEEEMEKRESMDYSPSISAELSVFDTANADEVEAGFYRIGSSGKTALIVCTKPLFSPHIGQNIIRRMKELTWTFIVTMPTELCHGLSRDDEKNTIVAVFDDEARWVHIIRSLREFFLIHVHGEGKVYVVQCSSICSGKALLDEPKTPAEVLRLIEADELEAWCVNYRSPKARMSIYQRGAGNGKTYMSLQWLKAPDLVHKEIFIYLTKQHTAKSQILKELHKQQKKGQLELTELESNLGGRDIKQFKLVFTDATDRVLRVIIATLDSFMYAVGSPDAESRDYFEGIARSVSLGNMKVCERGFLRWSGAWCGISHTTLITLDEAQDNQVTYLHALECLQARTGVEVRIIGDVLQTLGHPENIMREAVGADEIDQSNIVRRFHNPALMNFVNSVVQFEKFGCPAICDICPGDQCGFSPHIDRMPEFLIMPATNGPDRDELEAAFVDKCLGRMEEEILSGRGVLPEHFMFISPVLKNQSIPQRLHVRLQSFWKSMFEDPEYFVKALLYDHDGFWAGHRDDARGHEFAVLHMHAEGQSIRLEDSDRATRILSIHASKGTGRRVVFALDMTEENLRKFESDDTRNLPNRPTDLIYESLLHVAVTRQELTLFIGIRDNADDICHRMDAAYAKGLCRVQQDASPPSMHFTKVDLCRDIVSFAWNSDMYNHLCSAGGILTQCKQNLPEDTSKGIVDFAHHCIRRCLMHYAITRAIVHNEQTNYGGSQLRVRARKVGNLPEPEWFTDSKKYYARFYRRREDEKLPIPLLAFASRETSRNDYGKYKEFFRDLVNDVQVKIKGDDLSCPSLCPIETIIYYHLQEVCDYRIDVCGPMQVYAILRAYVQCGFEMIRGSHENSTCCCRKHLLSMPLSALAVPERELPSGGIAKDIMKHYEITRRVDKMYQSYKKSVDDILGEKHVPLKYNVDQQLELDSPYDPEFQTKHRFDFLGYNEDSNCAIAIDVIPQYTALNSKEVCFNLLFKAFLLHHCRHEKNDSISKRYKGKIVYFFVWTLNCETPFFIKYDFSSDNLQKQLLLAVRGGITDKFQKHHSQLYRMWKHVKTLPIESDKMKKDPAVLLKSHLDKLKNVPKYLLRVGDTLEADRKSWRKLATKGEDETPFMDMANSRLDESVAKYTDWDSHSSSESSDSEANNDSSG